MRRHVNRSTNYTKKSGSKLTFLTMRYSGWNGIPNSNLSPDAAARMQEVWPPHLKSSNLLQKHAFRDTSLLILAFDPFNFVADSRYLVSDAKQAANLVIAI